MTTILGIDLGERRIGVAIAEPDGFAARPLTTLRRSATVEGDAAAIQALIDTYEIDEIIVGLPLESAGREGVQAGLTRAWAEALAPLLEDATPITWQDERLSSHVAEQRLGPMKRGRSGGPPSRTQRDAYRARVDREAASIILQDALDERRSGDAARSAPPTTMETRT